MDCGPSPSPFWCHNPASEGRRGPARAAVRSALRRHPSSKNTHLDDRPRRPHRGDTMRPTRKRKAIALRFDSLEPRALQAGGVTPNDTLFSAAVGPEQPGHRRRHRGPRRPGRSPRGARRSIVADIGSTEVNAGNPDLASKLWTNPGPPTATRIPGALHGWNFTDHSPDLKRHPTATGPTWPGSSPPPRTTARRSPASPGPRRSCR